MVDWYGGLYVGRAKCKYNIWLKQSGYGGLKLEYTPKVNSVFYISFPLLIGGSMASIDSVNRKNNFFNKRRSFGRGSNQHNGYIDESYGRRSGNGSDFFVIQPGVNIEANVFKFAKIFVGASYRIATDVSFEKRQITTISTLPIPTASQLSGLSVNAGVKIGVFDYQLGKRKRNKLFGFRRNKNQSKN